MPCPGPFPTSSEPELLWVSPILAGSAPAFPFPVPQAALGSSSSCGLYETGEQKGRVIPSHTNCRAQRLLAGKGSSFAEALGEGRLLCPDLPVENQVPSAVSQAGESAPGCPGLSMSPAITPVLSRPGTHAQHRGKGTLHGQGRQTWFKLSKEMS